MRKRLTLLTLLIISFLIFGCTNFNTAKSSVSSTELENNKVVTQSCINECTTDSCNELRYIGCVAQPNGCKSLVFYSETLGKCGVECKTNKDCSTNNECKNYKCLIPQGYSRTTPATIDTPVEIEVDDYTEQFKAKITLRNITRGDIANKVIERDDIFNNKALEGKEYVLIKIRFELLKTKNDNSYTINEYYFDIVSNSGNVYDSRSMTVAPKPELDKELYPGASNEGWIAFRIDKTDTKPLLRYKHGNNAIWFQLY